MKKVLFISLIGLMVLVLGSWGWSQESVSNDIITLMDAVLSKMTQMVQPNTLIGAPIQVGDVTVVPVIKVDVGFGGGGGLGIPAGQPSGGGTGGFIFSYSRRQSYSALSNYSSFALEGHY